MSAALEARLSALESELREARLRIAQLEARRVRPAMHLGSTDSDPLLPADGEIWYRNDSDKLFLRRNGANVDVQDHGSGNGLADDDHAQYALLAGRSGGQTLIGGTASGDDLTLKSTSNATKGTVFLGTASAYDETNHRLGLGMTGPTATLHVSGTTKLDGGDATVRSDTATPAGGSSSARLLFGTTSGFGIYYGSGAPSVSAAKGSLYLRSDGAGTTSRLYVNTDGSTTWTAVFTIA